MEETTEKKEIKAKSASLIGQIIAAAWIAGWAAFYIIKNAGSVKITDIIFSGMAIAACFSPVYFNMLLDKIKDIRWG